MQVWGVIDRPSNEKEIKCSNGTPVSWTDFFASIPPITALRILFALAVTRKIPNLSGKLVEMSNETCLNFHRREEGTFGVPPGSDFCWNCLQKQAILTTRLDYWSRVFMALEMRPPIGRRLLGRSCWRLASFKQNPILAYTTMLSFRFELKFTETILQQWVQREVAFFQEILDYWCSWYFGHQEWKA